MQITETCINFAQNAERNFSGQLTHLDHSSTFEIQFNINFLNNNTYLLLISKISLLLSSQDRMIFCPEFVCKNIELMRRYKEGKNTQPQTNISVPLVTDTWSSHSRFFTVKIDTASDINAKKEYVRIFPAFIWNKKSI